VVDVACRGRVSQDGAEVAGVDAVLKWPNDLLVGPARGKCAGVLAEVVNGPGNAVVLGIGLNVMPLPDDVPAGAGGLPRPRCRAACHYY